LLAESDEDDGFGNFDEPNDGKNKTSSEPPLSTMKNADAVSRASADEDFDNAFYDFAKAEHSEA
jgi:hypothetical protein